MPSLKGKIVLVAGGTGEVGEGIVHVLLRTGAAVVVPSRSEEKLEQLQDRIDPRSGGNFVAISGDVGSAKGVLQVRERVDAVARRLDAVVTVIGRWWQKGPLIFSNHDDWQAVLASNLTPHYLIANAFLPVINKVPGGSYLVVTGAGADVPVPNSGLVSIAAHAQLMIVRVLASEHRHEPVRVNALVLGTPIVSRSRPEGDADWLTADEVGRYAAWLISGESAERGEILRFNCRSQLESLEAAS
jgi:NAD(P)-dependent dehydrogenase (short-subunit alcohol dehydrogenase family)